jgi:hypothetical protein
LRNQDHADLIEPYVHSFIVKVWVEEPAHGADRPNWRGHVTHVPGGERRYLKDLGDIVDFIAPYLEQIALRFDTLRQAERD